MNSVIVLGAKGFIGRHLCPKLEQSGLRITQVVRTAVVDSSTNTIDLDESQSVRQLSRLIEQREAGVIINLIANGVTPNQRKPEDVQSAVNRANHLSQVLSEHRRVKLLHIDSNVTSMSSNDVDDYSRAKEAFTKALYSSSIANQVRSLTLPRVFGSGEPKGRFVRDVIGAALGEGKYLVLHPCKERNYVSAENVAVFLLSALKLFFEGNKEDSVALMNTDYLSHWQLCLAVAALCDIDVYDFIEFEHSIVLDKQCTACPQGEEHSPIQFTWTTKESSRLRPLHISRKNDFQIDLMEQIQTLRDMKNLKV